MTLQKVRASRLRRSARAFSTLIVGMAVMALVLFNPLAAHASTVNLVAHFHLYGEVQKFGIGYGDMDIHFGVNLPSDTPAPSIEKLEVPVTEPDNPLFTLKGSGALDFTQTAQKGTFTVVDRTFNYPFSIDIGDNEQQKIASLYMGFGDNGIGGPAGGDVQTIFDFSDNIVWPGDSVVGPTVIGTTPDQGLRLTSVTLPDGSPYPFAFNPGNTMLRAGASSVDTLNQAYTENTVSASVTDPTIRAAVFLAPVAAATSKLKGGSDQGGRTTDALVDLDVSPEPNPPVFDLAAAMVYGTDNVTFGPPPSSTPPTVNVSFPSPVHGPNGWFNAADTTPVVGTVTASDASNVTNISCTGATLSGITGYNTNTASGTLTVAGDGTHDVTCTATNGASPASTGAAAGSSNTATIKIDTTPPAVSATVSPNPVLLNGSATATANATDAVSGVDTQSCANVSTTAPGPQSVNCTATDRAGNTTTGTANYTVIFRWSGFLPPLNGDPTVVNVGNAGRTYPIKWQLTDANGSYVTDAVNGTTISVAKVACTNLSGDATDTIDYASATGGTSLRYDSTANQYVYNWATPSTTNTCYRMTVTTPDTQQHIAPFQMK
jgi:hypothetical protein